MNDDWRVQVSFHEEGAIDKWHEHGHARELERDLSSSFQNRAIVSRVDSVLFVYAADQAQAESARELVESQAQEQGWALESDLTHWNEETLEWEPPPGKSFVGEGADSPAEPVPSTAPPAEGQEDAEEARPSEFEVRAELPSRHDAIDLADRLRAEGRPCVRRWSHVVVGGELTARPS